MHQDTVEKIEHALEGWPLLDSLPIDDRYDIFSYENAVIHKSVTAYYHEETHEYKLRMQVGFVEFCRIEYITNSLEIFGEKLSKELMQLLEDMVTFNLKNISSLVIKKGICDWAFAKELPETLEGYQLFIKPQQPVKINNGSYIIIDYVDFTHASDVTIYYNMYRDEFFGEARIHSIPDVTYDFDSNELVELQEKLEKHLVPRMREARQAADAAAHEGEA